MDSSIASPIADEKVLGRVAKFLRVIASAGISPEVMQLLINDQSIRHRFIEGLKELVQSVQQTATQEIELGEINTQWFADMLQTVYQGQVPYDRDRLVEQHCSRIAIESLLRSLRNDRARTIAIMYYGLNSLNGQTTSVHDLAEKFGVSESVIRTELTRLNNNIREFVRVHRGLELTQAHLDFATLRFSRRLLGMLWRAKITDIKALTSQTEDGLLSMNTNFGGKYLAEVNAKLAERGLSLQK